MSVNYSVSLINWDYVINTVLIDERLLCIKQHVYFVIIGVILAAQKQLKQMQHDCVQFNGRGFYLTIVPREEWNML